MKFSGKKKQKQKHAALQPQLTEASHHKGNNLGGLRNKFEASTSDLLLTASF